MNYLNSLFGLLYLVNYGMLAPHSREEAASLVTRTAMTAIGVFIGHHVARNRPDPERGVVRRPPGLELDPPGMLETRLNEWSAEGDVDLRSLANSVTDLTDRAYLSTYLRRVREVDAYQNINTMRNTSRRIVRMLQTACVHESFRNTLLACVHHAPHTCGDRMAVVLNDMEVHWHLCQPCADDEALKRLALRVQRYRKIEKLAIKEVEECPHLEELETVLAYHSLLQKDLDLPIAPQGMLFPICSMVTPGTVEQMREKILRTPDRVLLGESLEWQARMKELYPARVAEIEDHFGDLMLEAGEYYDQDSEAEQIAFLSQHEELAAILLEPDVEPPITDYDSAMKGIAQKSYEAIALLIPK